MGTTRKVNKDCEVGDIKKMKCLPRFPHLTAEHHREPTKARGVHLPHVGKISSEIITALVLSNFCEHFALGTVFNTYNFIHLPKATLQGLVGSEHGPFPPGSFFFST